MLRPLLAIEIQQRFLPHITNWVGIPKKNSKGEHLKLGLKCSMFASRTLGVVGITLRMAGVINWTLIFQGVPPTKLGCAKSVQNSAQFFFQLSTLIANISGTDRRIENLKSSASTTFHPILGAKNLVNFSSPTKKLRSKR